MTCTAKPTLNGRRFNGKNRIIGNFAKEAEMKWDLFWIRVMLTLLVLYHLDVIYWQVTTQCAIHGAGYTFLTRFLVSISC